jgi:hypothetical protein
MKGFLFDENLPRVPSLQTGLPVTHPVKTKQGLWGLQGQTGGQKAHMRPSPIDQNRIHIGPAPDQYRTNTVAPRSPQSGSPGCPKGYFAGRCLMSGVPAGPSR